MKKAVLVIATILTLCSFKSESNVGIPSGEKLVFVGSYNMSGLIANLAQVTLSTDIVTTSKMPTCI